jgi:hypothetical protein
MILAKTKKILRRREDKNKAKKIGKCKNFLLRNKI